MGPNILAITLEIVELKAIMLIKNDTPPLMD